VVALAASHHQKYTKIVMRKYIFLRQLKIVTVPHKSVCTGSWLKLLRCVLCGFSTHAAGACSLADNAATQSRAVL
jgi:hypothetical protein